MHRIVIIDGEREISLLRSIEGDGQLAWPPSPPLQDVSEHELPAGDAILGVGMAGSNHWSASFSVQTANEVGVDDRSQILADIACFCKKDQPESIDALRSSYAVEPGVEMSDRDSGGLILQQSQHSVLIVPFDVGSNLSSRLMIAGDRISITARRLNEQQSKPHRWGYRLAVSDCSK